MLFGAWGCPEKSEQSKKESVGAAEIAGAPETVEEKNTDTVEATQAGTGQVTEAAKEKARKVIEELQGKAQGLTEETKGSE
jgi:hypothetical protein